MTLKNVLACIWIKSIIGTLIFKSAVLLAVMAISLMLWIFVDIYQNTIEEWR